MANQEGHRFGGYGTLYVVSTPIGNLEDITLRALRVLKGVALIAAENVSHTSGLCRHYGIQTKLTSYNQHNRKAKGPKIIGRLQSGEDIAVVTDAGTPGISDPGVYLISLAAKEEITVTPIPGPSAVIAALSVSGLPTDRFIFLGFLSNKPARRRKDLRQLISEPRTLVFFEAPHRVKAMLIDVRDILGDREMVMAREVTKVFEEVKRGPVSDILKRLSPEEPRGEFTIIVKGSREEQPAQDLGRNLQRKIRKLLAEKRGSLKDIAQLVSREEGVAYRQVYRECLALKKASQDDRRKSSKDK
jgi:16S rRNA (cytidine1402-2'-O)-methyltransferase